MKHLIAVGFTVLGFTLIAGPSVVSAEHTAYAFRSTDGQFLEIALPSEAPSEPTWADPVSRDLSWNGAGSTRDSDERILSLDFISSEIIAFDPFVPIHQVVSTLGLPLHWTSDLSLGPGDDLILLREDELFDVDPATGSTVLRAQLGQDYGSIEYHQGFFTQAAAFTNLSESIRSPTKRLRSDRAFPSAGFRVCHRTVPTFGIS